MEPQINIYVDGENHFLRSEDCFRHFYSDPIFDHCILLSSDEDFMPAIETIKRMGKKVSVLGYARYLRQFSPLFYAPDRFFDLEKLIIDEYRPDKGVGVS